MDSFQHSGRKPHISFLYVLSNISQAFTRCCQARGMWFSRCTPDKESSSSVAHQPVTLICSEGAPVTRVKSLLNHRSVVMNTRIWFYAVSSKRTLSKIHKNLFHIGWWITWGFLFYLEATEGLENPAKVFSRFLTIPKPFRTPNVNWLTMPNWFEVS